MILRGLVNYSTQIQLGREKYDENVMVCESKSCSWVRHYIPGPAGRGGEDGDRESGDSEVKSHFTPVYNSHY